MSQIIDSNQPVGQPGAYEVIDLTSPVELEPAQTERVQPLPVFVQAVLPESVKPEPVENVKPEPVGQVKPGPVEPVKPGPVGPVKPEPAENVKPGPPAPPLVEPKQPVKLENPPPEPTPVKPTPVKPQPLPSKPLPGPGQPVVGIAAIVQAGAGGFGEASGAGPSAFLDTSSGDKHGPSNEQAEFEGRKTPLNLSSLQLTWLEVDRSLRKSGLAHMTDEQLAIKLQSLGDVIVTAADVAEWMQAHSTADFTDFTAEVAELMRANYPQAVPGSAGGRVNWTRAQLTWLEIEETSRREGTGMGDEELARVLRDCGGGDVTAADVAEWLLPRVPQAAKATAGKMPRTMKEAEPVAKTGRRLYNNQQKKILEEELDKSGWKERASGIAERISGLQGGREVNEKDVVKWIQSNLNKEYHQMRAVMNDIVPVHDKDTEKPDFQRALEQFSASSQGKPDKTDPESTSKRKFYNRSQQELLEEQFMKIENFEKPLPNKAIAEMVDKLDGGREVEERDINPWMSKRRQRGMPY